jgi:2-oxo-4-hydroxy-4-carboxy-5-ureidoimidazoline decarboxylase
MITLDSLNRLAEADFITTFGDIAEHSAWVADEVEKVRPFSSRRHLVETFASALYRAGHERQLALLRAHPDLASRAKLTEDSTGEQRSAGLDTLTAQEYTMFNSLNHEYRSRFGFPFILAVKGATKHQIIESFQSRISCSPSDEFNTALEQVAKIMRLRLEERVAP